MYTDQTGRHIKIRIKEHQPHCNKENTEKLFVAEHWYVRGKPIHFRDTELQESSAYLKESIEITLHERKKTFNNVESYKLNQIWKTTIAHLNFNT